MRARRRGRTTGIAWSPGDDVERRPYDLVRD